ncbi:MAG: M48 family metalloprotease [Candidatus Aenigmarchaeota archaeon]|nr:M48 family metalloprotease [Candidatus Aenigmarchaeota archaeon]
MIFFASAFAAVLFFVSVLGALFAVPILAGNISFSLAAIITLAFIVALCLAAPVILDRIFARFYGLQFISLSELRLRSPASASFIEEACKRHSWKVPRLALIKEPSPNSFVYGHGIWNARLAVTEGLLNNLDENERVSVYAHEMGHLKNRDFILMTPMAALLQLFFELCLRFKFLALPLQGIRMVLEFAVLPLSREKEYLADEYASHETHHNHLAMALLKISYGIAHSESRRLADSARYMGIMDAQSAASGGIAYHNAKNSRSFESLKRSLSHDFTNPWASFAELGLAHPLLGKRLKRLSGFFKDAALDFDAMETNLKEGKMQPAFAKDIFSLAFPFCLSAGFPLLYLLLAFAGIPFRLGDLAGGWLISAGIASVLLTMYKYPSGVPRAVTAAELALYPNASPVHGKLVSLRGRLLDGIIAIGNVFQDKTGFLRVDYKSNMPSFLGPSCKELAGKYAKVTGWFTHDTCGTLIVDTVESPEGKANSFVKSACLMEAAVLMIAGIIVFLIH